MLAVICVAGTVAAAGPSGGNAVAASRAIDTAGTVSTLSTGSTASTAAAPPTPLYWPRVLSERSSGAQTITGGALWHTEAYQTAGGGQQAQVMDIDLGSRNLRFGAVEAGDQLIDPSDETISSMATRTGAVAGVNADFFAIHATGQPLGMLVLNGTLEASPVPSWPSDLEVLDNGQIEMSTETFSGAVTDTTTGTTHALAALNRTDQNGLTEVTPFLGASAIGASTIAAGTVNNGVLTVTSVRTSQIVLPRLAAGQEDLIARRGTADSIWLQQVHPGDTLTVSSALAPYGIGQVRTAVSGGAYLVRNGAMAVPAQGGGENNVLYPVTGIGVSKDGTHAIMVVFDGREGLIQAGLTRPQFAQWMLSRGAYNAIELDSGGSTEMVARLPGQAHVSVLNRPSDGSERPVANGLFLYSTESKPTAAIRAVVNNDQPMAVLTGTTELVSTYSTDAVGNPAATGVHVSVAPPGLATITGSPTRDGTAVNLKLTAGRQAGSGWLIAQAGHAVTREPLTVTASPRSLTVSPAQPDLNNGAAQQFSVSGKAANSIALTITPRDVTWTVSTSRLGTVSPAGRFTAAGTGMGLVTVTATAGGRSAAASVAVGHSAVVVDPMIDASRWALSPPTNGAAARLSVSATQIAQAGDQGSLDVRYSIPAASGVSQLIFHPSPGHGVTIGAAADGRTPDEIGIWIKGTGGTPATPLAPGALTFAEAYIEVNGALDTFYPAAVTYHGWQFVEARVPAGARLPLTLSFLDLLVTGPQGGLAGDVYLSDLQALYPPR
jgi:hypothetical protein